VGVDREDEAGSRVHADPDDRIGDRDDDEARRKKLRAASSFWGCLVVGMLVGGNP
jgi:hypothetical protein